MINDYYKILSVSKANTKNLKKNLIESLEIVKIKKGKISDLEEKNLKLSIVGYYILSNSKYKKMYDQVLVNNGINTSFNNIESALNENSETIIKNMKIKYTQSDSGIGDVFAFILQVASEIIK